MPLGSQQGENRRSWTYGGCIEEGVKREAQTKENRRKKVQGGSQTGTNWSNRQRQRWPGVGSTVAAAFLTRREGLQPGILFFGNGQGVHREATLITYEKPEAEHGNRQLVDLAL